MNIGIVFRYFWFFGALVMLINIAIWRHRLRGVVRAGVASEAEVARFVKWLVVWFVGWPIVMGVIAIAAGWSSPFCGGVLAFGTVPQAMTSVLMIASSTALLWWVWRGRGADFLARVGPALGNRPRYDKPYSPVVVRGVVTLMAVVGTVGAAVQSRAMPEMTQTACTMLDAKP